MALKVVAIVLNWNGFSDTESCVKSLQKVTSPPLEIVIVDNCSTDGSAEILANAFPNVPLIHRSSNGGYAAGNNEGIRHALVSGADHVLIINNDVIVEPDFLSPLVRILEERPKVGIVTCKAFFQRREKGIYCTAGRFSRLRCSGAPLPKTLTDRKSDVSYISGCILLVRKEVFERVGFLDEKFFMYFEDMEFSNRVRKVYTLAYTPAGTVYHKSGGGDSLKNFTEFYLYYTTRNRLLAFHESPWPYRVYVVVFSVTLAIAKSFVILFYIAKRPRMYNSGRRIAAIWKGIVHGCQGVTRQISF
jgi:GT2 family glycosyltransferase